jgi:hypothetical protein
MKPFQVGFNLISQIGGLVEEAEGTLLTERGIEITESPRPPRGV